MLQFIGIGVASSAAVIAAAGFAIGLAFQGTLSNFSAGVMLLTFRPFKVGQVVNAAGVTGTVDEIELFNTTIDTFDNRRFIVPNSSLFANTIENISFHSERRADVNVGVDYSADIDRTREVLTAAAESVEGVIEGEGRGACGDPAGPRGVERGLDGAHLDARGRPVPAQGRTDAGGQDAPRRGRHRHSVPADGRSPRRRSSQWGGFAGGGPVGGWRRERHLTRSF